MNGRYAIFFKGGINIIQFSNQGVQNGTPGGIHRQTNRQKWNVIGFTKSATIAFISESIRAVVTTNIMFEWKNITGKELWSNITGLFSWSNWKTGQLTEKNVDVEHWQPTNDLLTNTTNVFFGQNPKQLRKKTVFIEHGREKLIDPCLPSTDHCNARGLSQLCQTAGLPRRIPFNREKKKGAEL